MNKRIDNDYTNCSERERNWTCLQEWNSFVVNVQQQVWVVIARPSHWMAFDVYSLSQVTLQGVDFKRPRLSYLMAFT